MKISIDKVRRADLRYYDDEHHGIELTDSQSKAILVDLGFGYLNLFNLGEGYPVFDRSKFTNISSAGEDYGTKMIPLSENFDTGPCWVLEAVNMRNELKKAFVSIEDIENYILESSDFYKDRTEIARRRIRHLEHPVKMVRIINADKNAMRSMNEFFSARECGLQKVKED